MIDKLSQIKKNISIYPFSCGVDEVGAGVLAGDLIVCALILDNSKPIKGLHDSKKISPIKREALYPEILEKCLDYSIARITSSEIDKINIYQARLLGFKKAIEGLKFVEYAIIDGNMAPSLSIPHDYLIKGDSLIEQISAASIVAKVFRDREMMNLANTYPGYGFENHKGYGTKEHLLALEKLGPCPIHRFSYKPVKNCPKL